MGDLDEKEIPLTTVPMSKEDKEDDVEYKPKRKPIRDKLYEMVSSGTINGLSQALSAKLRIIQIFWICVFIFALFEFSWSVYHLAVRYNQAPVLSQIDPKYTPFTWPDFTVCNPSNPIPFWTTEGLEDKWKKLVKVSNFTLPSYGPPTRSKTIWWQYVAMSSLNPAVYFSKGFEGSFQVVKAQYDDPTIASSSSDYDQFETVPTSQEDDELVQTNLDSIRAPLPCYRIKPREIVRRRNTTLDKLMTLKLYILMDLESYKIYNSGFENRKAYFYITNENATIQSAHPYFVAPGTSSIFNINEHKKDRVKGCRDKHFPIDVFHYDLSKVKRLNGGFDDCRFHLSQSIFLRECGCYNTYLPLYKYDDKLPRVCTNLTLFNKKQMAENIKCLNRVLLVTLRRKEFEAKLNASCADYKKRLCSSSTYSVVLSTNVWPKNVSASRQDSLQRMKKFMKNAKNRKTVAADFIYENLAIIELFKSKDSVERTYEEFAYTRTQFVSDIGGVAGLWIGLSLISVFELVAMLLSIIAYLRTN